MLFRSRGSILVGVFLTLAFMYFMMGSSSSTYPQPQKPVMMQWKPDEDGDPDYFWKKVTMHYPVSTFQPLPTSRPRNFPKVQAPFKALSKSDREKREQRRQTVKQTFQRCWASYKKHAWMADELQPVSGGQGNPFGGWAATLVDSLDTLWIMDMKDEFDEAVAAAEKIDFTKTNLGQVNIFETTIRYLGGFLAAYDLSGDKRLLRKAVEVGEMIYKAFDTPNHMPITRWNPKDAINGEKQVAGSGVLLAEIGSLCMELTHLSQLTGDAKWFDASQGIMDKLAAQQDSTSLPGQWPLVVNAESLVFNTGETFTLGAMADSTYEYLPKMAALLGGQLPVYQTMYEKAMDKALKHNIFRPMTPENNDILFAGQIHAKQKDGKVEYELESQGQHLVCFLGGLMALGGRLFDRKQDVEAGLKLTNGCVYAYSAFPHGIMPETFYAVPCASKTKCEWDEALWKAEVFKQAEKKDGEDLSVESIIADSYLPRGFTRVPDRRYILRPEAIESVFVLYRITAQAELAEQAWNMFTAIEEATKTDLANTALWDVLTPGGKPREMDSMESFWLGETLKYFYLVFSEPELISLDEFVFNTEAHPLRRLVA